jgi:hypothetical protein
MLAVQLSVDEAFAGEQEKQLVRAVDRAPMPEECGSDP